MVPKLIQRQVYGPPLEHPFRDLVRTSLIPDARYLVIGLATTYKFMTKGKASTSRDYREGRAELDALFASQRLQLPFKGVLLLGY